MVLIDTIRTLHARGWPARRIARELGIHRETVARYLHRGDQPAKPANAPIGSEDGSRGVSAAASTPKISPLGDGD
jgi:IS30 family transposase